jgi:hypothetical protein
MRHIEKLVPTGGIPLSETTTKAKGLGMIAVEEIVRQP